MLESTRWLVILQTGYDYPAGACDLEAAVLESKKRGIDTPEARAALDLLEPYIRPAWLVPQFRNNLERTADGPLEVSKEGQQQVLRATFPGIRDAVRELLGVRGCIGS